MRAEGVPGIARVWADHRRGLLTWGLALAGITVLYLAFWPMMGDDMQAAIDGMPEGLIRALGYDDIGTGAGYLEAVVYGLLGPILLLVYGIGLGGRVIAGQEEDGTLELDLAAPVSRARLYWERLAGVWALVTVLIAITTLAVLASGPLFDLQVAVANVLASSLALWLFVGGFATIALAIGAATGRRGAGVGAAAGLATLAFVLRSVGDAANVDALAAVSPFAWMLAGEPLVNGLDVAGAAKLALLSLVAAPLGAWRFVRRDLMV
jgi:ABC-2 type transport system permease protein